MKLILSLFIIIISLFLVSSCSFSKLEEKDRDFSTSLSESKKHNTFIKEYSCKLNIRSDSLKLAIKRAWLEKSCFYKEGVFKSMDSKNKTLLMDINICENLYLNSNNFLKKWDIATNDTNLAGQLRNLYGISFYKNESVVDTIDLNIFNFDSADNINVGLRSIGSIILIPK